MVITQAQILRAVPDTYKPNLTEFIASFNMWAIHFGIDSPKRIVMYLAQVFHESARLKSCEENMNYSAQRLMQVWPNRFKTLAFAQQYAHKPEKIASYVYASRMGNGDEASGDGWKFRGRGYIGITGREMYQKYAKSEWCVGDLMSHPEWLAKSPDNQKASMWFWLTNNLNKWADVGNVDMATKVINGGVNGLADRKFLYRRFEKEFGI